MANRSVATTRSTDGHSAQILDFPAPRRSLSFEARVDAGREFFLALDPRRDEAKATDIASRMAARCEELKAANRARSAAAAQIIPFPARPQTPELSQKAEELAELLAGRSGGSVERVRVILARTLENRGNL